MGASVAMPAPELGACGDTSTLPTLSYTRLGGVNTTVVLAPRPALMSPFSDHARMSPPKVVMMRDSPSSRLPSLKKRMLPCPCVSTPEVAGGTAPCTPRMMLPPGASMSMSPPNCVRTPEPPNMVMSPSSAARIGNSAAIISRPRR
ncbi:hypothetical protein D3C71_1661160 [compost metagenome]